MGKKTVSHVAGSSVGENSTLLSGEQHETLRTRKNRALKVLGEYMRYFSSVNGLYRNMVHMQAEVVSKHGQSRWKELSQEHQDEALDRHIINNTRSQVASQPGLEGEGITEKDKTPSPKPGNRRDSLQSVLDQDSFSGPFCWKSKSLQELAFPSTPELNLTSKQRDGIKHHKDKKASRLKPETISTASESEDEVTPSKTLDQLRGELRRNYKEQQAARLKLRQLEVEKNFGIQREREGITKAAVKQRSSRNPFEQTLSSNVGRLPVAPSDLKQATQLRQVNEEIMRTRTNTEKSPIKTAHSFKDSSRSPGKANKTKTNTKDRQYAKSDTREEINSKRSPVKDSLDFDEILRAAEEAHQKRTNNSIITKQDVLLRRDTETTRSRNHSQFGCKIKEGESPNRQKISSNEIQGNLSQDLRHRCDVKSGTENDTSDIMELFKNW